jgi:hypothetical protein
MTVLEGALAAVDVGAYDDFAYRHGPTGREHDLC